MRTKPPEARGHEIPAALARITLALVWVLAGACGGGGGGGGGDDAGSDASDAAHDGGGDDGGLDADVTGTFAIAGTTTGAVEGLVLTLRVDGEAVETLDVSEDAFEFETLLDDGDDYLVSVSPTTTEQACEIASGGAGTIAGANVEDVVVRCVHANEIGNLGNAACEGVTPTLGWSTVAEADAYLVRFSPVLGGADVDVVEDAPSTTLTSTPALAPGNYTIRVAPRRGALQAPFSAPANIGVFETPDGTPTAASPAPACLGTNVMLSASGAEGDEIYRWTGPNGFMRSEDIFSLELISAEMFGTYQVRFVNGPCASAPTDVQVTEETVGCP